MIKNKKIKSKTEETDKYSHHQLKELEKDLKQSNLVSHSNKI